MSIYQVESFYDSIKKYRTVKEITKGATLEAKYLNEVSGATANLKRYLTVVKQIQDAVNSYNYLKYLFENIHEAKNAEELRTILPYNLNTAALIPS